MHIINKFTNIILCSCDTVTTRDRTPPSHDEGSHTNFTYLLNWNFRYNFFFKLQCKYTCITFNIILYHSSSVLLHLGKYPHMCTYTYANHMYTCPYVAVIKRPDILQIIIQYSAEILWLYSYRPFTNKMHTYISMPVYATQRSSIFATHTHCHQRPSLSYPYLFTCNIKERQWDKNLSKQRARRA